MSQQQKIRKQALSLYGEFLGEWIRGEVLAFPKKIPRPNLSLRRLDFAQRHRLVTELRAESKDEKGYGYSIRWHFCKSPLRGHNAEPRGLCFETPEDLLRYLGKKEEFEKIERVVELIRQQLPQLEHWLVEHKKVSDLVAYHDSIEGLLEVASYFANSPRPNLYLRQLPLSVSTKFIERNVGKLRPWLDILVAKTVDHRYQKFERRYGLREKEEHVKCRILDCSLFGIVGVHHEEFMLPLANLQQLKLSDVTVIIVENEMNLLTLPPYPRGLAMWGRGDWVAKFAELQWLHDCSIIYWGDVDVPGFEALSSLRKFFGMRIRSLLMDAEAVAEHGHLACTSQEHPVCGRLILTDLETEALRWCSENKKCLEQEKIPQPFVDHALQAMGAASLGQ